MCHDNIRNKMKTRGLTIFSTCLAIQLHAQTVPHCASDWFPDDETFQWMEDQITEVTSTVADMRGGGPCPIWRIPVVFHVVADPGNSASNIPDGWILNQLAWLNAEFVNNLDGVGATPCIQFCLAQNTPNNEDWLTDFGSPTPGITRWSDLDGSVVNTVSVSDLMQLVSIVQFPTDRYFNVWIISDVQGGPPGTAGFGTFPVSAGAIDGVLIEYPWITQAGVEGDLLIHETGHYLGLYHTFQGNCADQDQCTDTPPQLGPTNSCTPPASCGVPEMVENHMNYAPESCLNTFTTCQVDRMQAQLVLWRPGLITTANGILTGILGPDGCAPLSLTAEFIASGTQFCTGTTVGQFNGVLSVDAWDFEFAPQGGAVAYNPTGSASIPSASYAFPTAGSWTVTLNVTMAGATETYTMTVWVTDCIPILMSQAQWYFGAYCALDFSSGVPVAIDNSAMWCEDQPANACDPVTGIMQLYGSNSQIYNSGHQFMPPGAGGSAYSNSIAVPDPGNADRYYVFYTSDRAPGQPSQELHYYVIDMTLNTGGASGGIVPGEANVSVGVGEPHTTKHLSAVPHCNGTDFWVVTHDFVPGAGNTASQFLSYRLTGSGIAGPAVISPSFTVGSAYGQGLGEIDFKHDGDMAAVTSPENVSCYLYSFDRENGTFSLITTLQPFTSNNSAVSFSRSGDFLYTVRGGTSNSLTGRLYQHDLRGLDLCDPLPPPNNATAFPDPLAWTGLQLGPDDKLYMSNNYTDFISVINFPEIWNTNPNDFGFNWQGVSIQVPGGTNQTCRVGLPNMIDAMPNDPLSPDFFACTDCLDANFRASGCINVVQWDVNCDGVFEGTGGQFSWTFPGPGTYSVCMLADGVQIQHDVTIDGPDIPNIVTGVACLGVPATFSTTNTSGLPHSWTVTGGGTIVGPDDDPTVVVTWSGSGTVSVSVTDVDGCSVVGVLNIAPVDFQPDAGPDVELCPNEAAVLNVPGAVDCIWNPTVDLDLTDPCSPVFTPSGPGGYPYSVTATDANGCTGTDEVIIQVDPIHCAPDFTISKTATPTQTYAGSPVVFIITVCNNTGAQATVSIVDQLPSDFTLAFTNGTNPLTGAVTLDPGCTDFLISGYFSTIGMCNNPDPDVVAMHTNTVTLDDGNGTVLTADACVGIMVGCPMSVAGTGGCSVDDPVNMCLLVHTQFTGVTAVDYQLLFPTFLSIPGAPPAGAVVDLDNTNTWEPFAGANIQGGGASTISWQPYTNPYPGPLGFYNVATIHVEYTAPVNVSPPYQFLCIDFTLQSAPPALQNAWSVFALSPGNTLNQVQVTPVGTFYTQALNVTLNGCPGIDELDAGFTVEVPNCGGAVTVNANLTDPGAVHIWTWGDDRTTPTNGAQTWTYDYFEEITDNQGWPVNIPPADPGTYTITHTVIVDGVASTSTQEITIYQCCEANTEIPDGATASSTGNFFSGTVDIQGQFIVDVNTLFNYADVYMEPGAEIVVLNGVDLRIENSNVESCQDVMWKSITAQDGSLVRIKASRLEDAESTVAALDGSTVLLSSVQFHNNRVGLGVPDMGLPYNNVSVWMAGSTFTSAGPMPQPYPGQATAVGSKGFAAIDARNTTLDLTAGGNVIDGMSNGIVGHYSDLDVEGFVMRNIQPDAAYDYVGNGAGIYARGDHGFYTLRQQGYGQNGTVNFDKCRWGIYTEYMNVYSKENNMLSMGTAYRVDRTGLRNVAITDNKMSTRYNGIDLRANDGAASILVRYNIITFGNDPTCINCRGWFGIYVSEGNYANPSSRIQNNTIFFLPQYASRYGIGLFAADSWRVVENQLYMASNAFNENGIWTNGCRGHEISCNTVVGAGTTYPNDRQAAIRNMLGREPLISCNDVDLTANGILFNGVASNTELRGNKMRNHKWALHLDATAVIGTQTRKGNLWYNAAAPGGLGALHDGGVFQASLSMFLYDPATISGGSTFPPSLSPPTGWFVYDPGTNYDCANDHGGEYCSQFYAERDRDKLTELDERVAADSLENDPYTDESKWMLKGDLYKKLDDHPALRDSLPAMADFYNDLQGSTTAAFKSIDDDQLALYDLDSSVVAQLQANRAQIEGLMALAKEDMAQLDDSTLTTGQQQALLTSLNGYRQNIATLTAWNTTALQVAGSSKVLSAEGVKAANAGIATTELIEANEKTVNDIYLATIGKDVDEFTTAQASELFDIASQCPMVGGNAVFKARSLYWLIDDSHDFDDQLLCLPHGIIVKSVATVEPNALTVVPNPASDEATLVLTKPLDEPGVFVLFDAIGAEVMRYTIPVETPRFAFSTSDLAPALYHYQVRGPAGVLGNGKLTIVR